MPLFFTIKEYVMNMLSLDMLVSYILGWPLILFVLGVSIFITIVTRCVQIRYFIKAWRYTLMPDKAVANYEGGTTDMSPIQAFINTLNVNLGNGSIAGMATALYSGGPGAAIWVVIISLLLMAVRYAEVYLSIYYSSLPKGSSHLGGPMRYVRDIWAGNTLAYIYAVFCFLFGLSMGNATQTNSIALSMATTFGIPPIWSACLLFVFVIYVVAGGAQRIVKLSEKLVPLKVTTFFVSTILLLAYHYQSIIPALQLMVKSAFSPLALAGGMVGFTVQQAMQFGILRSIMATESGLGTAAIFFSSTGSKTPAKDAIMTMLSTFISMTVCFMIALSIVASGVWNSGLTSTPLTIAAFDTVFGSVGGWIVSFLSISFGMGVLVSFAYITRECWRAIAGNRNSWFFAVIYCICAGMGPLINVVMLWRFCDVMNAVMLVINLLALVGLRKYIVAGLARFEQTQK